MTFFHGKGHKLPTPIPFRGIQPASIFQNMDTTVHLTACHLHGMIVQHNCQVITAGKMSRKVAPTILTTFFLPVALHIDFDIRT